MTAVDGPSVARAFGLGEVRALAHVADGMMARIWRLDCAAGSYAVKEFRDFVDTDELASRLEVSARLADSVRGAGVTTPRLIRATDGALLRRVGTGPDADRVDVSISSWIDGRPLRLTDDVPNAAAWLGGTLAAIELAPDPPDARPLDPWLTTWLTTAPTESDWNRVLERARSAATAWSELLAARIDQLTRLGAVLTPPPDESQSVLHTDLQPKNVLVTSTGFALLDWDDAARCSIDRLLGRTLIEWFTSGGVRTDLIPIFLSAYSERGGRGQIDDIAAFGYAVAAFLNNLYEMLDAALVGGRARGDTALLAPLTTPLNVATLEETLDILRSS